MPSTGAQPDHDEHALIARAREGSFDAFERLITPYEGRLYSMAMNLVRQREDAEDVVQTALLSAFEHLGDFREDAAFGTWITRIGLNAALKTLRRRKTARTRSLDQALAPDDAVDDGRVPHPEYIAEWRYDPAEIVARREFRQVLDDALEALPETLRVVFILRDLQGLSVRETAAVAGIGEANVKVRLWRARLALREALTRVFGDADRRLTRPHDDEPARPPRPAAGGPASDPASEGERHEV